MSEGENGGGLLLFPEVHRVQMLRRVKSQDLR